MHVYEYIARVYLVSIYESGTSADDHNRLQSLEYEVGSNFQPGYQSRALKLLFPSL